MAGLAHSPSRAAQVAKPSVVEVTLDRPRMAGYYAPHRSGPSKTWLKIKIPATEAVRREREEQWR